MPLLVAHGSRIINCASMDGLLCLDYHMREMRMLAKRSLRHPYPSLAVRLDTFSPKNMLEASRDGRLSVIIIKTPSCYAWPSNFQE